MEHTFNEDTAHTHNRHQLESIFEPTIQALTQFQLLAFGNTANYLPCRDQLGTSNNAHNPL